VLTDTTGILAKESCVRRLRVDEPGNLSMPACVFTRLAAAAGSNPHPRYTMPVWCACVISSTAACWAALIAATRLSSQSTSSSTAELAADVLAHGMAARGLVESLVWEMAGAVPKQGAPSADCRRRDKRNESNVIVKTVNAAA
jgi:hypothetical protein